MVDLKAVLFDLGGTLIKTAPPAEIIKRILENHSVKRSIDEIALAHKFAEDNTLPEDYNLSYYEFWTKWNRRIFDRLGILDEDCSLARSLINEWWDKAEVEVYPDAKDTLIRLKEAGFKVGVITNAFEKDIKEILKRVEIPLTFDVLVGIDTVKRAKPSPEIFLHAIYTLNILPNEAVYVGDDLEKDYVGAINAGLRAILLDRDSIYSSRWNLIKVKRLCEVLDLILKDFRLQPY
ncbi:MAG: HAD-IA family hydrolase [Thermoproteota archaeon]